jgi:hypothetical protein
MLVSVLKHFEWPVEFRHAFFLLRRVDILLILNTDLAEQP